MNSRPLLDYLAYPDDATTPAYAAQQQAERPMDALEARLKDLESRLRGHNAAQQGAQALDKAEEQPKQDTTLSAQIEAILRRKEVVQARYRAAQAASETEALDEGLRHARAIIDAPPSVPTQAAPGADADFARFSEAVYLIGQAAKRFAEMPQAAPAAAMPEPNSAVAAAPPAPSAVEIEALSAVLRETVSAFRSVADDLAVSVCEIRHMATREEKTQRAANSEMDTFSGMMRDTVAGFRAVADDLSQSVGRLRRANDRDERSERPRFAAPSQRGGEDDEILALRDNVSDLQQRLDMLLQARRRARY